MSSIVVADAGPLHYLILHILKGTSFFISNELLDAALERDRVRRKA